MTPLLLIAALATSHSSEWDAWYSEYVLATAGPTSQGVLTVHPNGIIQSDPASSIKSRLQDDTGRHINVRQIGGAFWADELPLFKPDNSTDHIVNNEHECSAKPASDGHLIACVNKNTKAILHSKFESGFGIRWFDYYCGIEFDICRYEFSKGSAFLGPKMTSHLRAASGKNAKVR